MGAFGILYFDNSGKRSLPEKFLDAADVFARKMKRTVEFGIVREDMLGGMTTDALSEEVGFRVILATHSHPVQPAHIFVGAEDLPKTAEEMDEE